MTDTIQSTQHPLVKHLVKLRESSSYRSDQKLVVVSGRKMTQEVNTLMAARVLLIDLSSSVPENLRFEQLIRISPRVMKKITGLQSPEEIGAVYPLPQESNLSKCNTIVVLDQMNDPGNLGTLIRTALAFGWDGIVFLGNCCDPFNEKALRASKGAIFRLPFTHLSLSDAHTFFAPWNLIGADTQGDSAENISLKEKFCLVVGSESHGLSSEIETLITKKVTLPMPGKMESLNASVAGGILLYLFRPKYS